MKIEASMLQRHNRAVHEKHMDFSCEICEFKTARKYNLDNHIKAKHTKNKDLICEECKFSAANKHL